MKYSSRFFLLLLFLILQTSGFAQNQKQEIRKLIDGLFMAMEKSDSIAFRSYFIDGSQNYYLYYKGDTVMTGNQPAKGFQLYARH